MKTSDLHIRDPYVVVHDGAYYLYGSYSTVPNDKSVYTFRSTDLENWSDPIRIFTIPEDSWASEQLWAPEVHLYRGRYYLFVSILGKHGLRGTQIAVSDTPDGEFIPVANKPATPMDKSCIDGTLWVEDGTPYVVYSRDWPDHYIAEKDIYIGEICAAQLTEDLADIVGEPFLLFESNDAPLSAIAPAVHMFEGKMVTRYGSDAPFLQKLSDGTLYLTWSPIPGNNYIVISVVSPSGKIRGPWTHLDHPLFDRNGGHAMFFTALNGQRMMSIHYPEKPPFERPLFLKVAESNGEVILAE